MRRITSLLIVFSLFLGGGQRSIGAVVYDSITSQFTYGRHTDHRPEGGQTVTLAGNARKVTKIEVQVGGNTDEEFQIRFYHLDGPGDSWSPVGHPGTLIWESPIQTFDWMPHFYNRTVIEVPVPNVIVPDTFAWTVASNPPGTVGVFGGTPAASVGIASSEWWYTVRPQFSLEYWVADDQVLGARITAIPEPATLAMLAIGLTFLPLLQTRSRCVKKPATKIPISWADYATFDTSRHSLCRST